MDAGCNFDRFHQYDDMIDDGVCKDTEDAEDAENVDDFDDCNAFQVKKCRRLFFFFFLASFDLSGATCMKRMIWTKSIILFPSAVRKC